MNATENLNIPSAVRFHRCSWCQAKGIETWTNQRGETVELKDYEKPADRDTSHGICWKCFEEVTGQNHAEAVRKQLETESNRKAA